MKKIKSEEVNNLTMPPFGSGMPMMGGMGMPSNMMSGDGSGQPLPPIEGDNVDTIKEVDPIDQTVSDTNDTDNTTIDATESVENEVINAEDIPTNEAIVEVDERTIVAKVAPMGISEKAGEKKIVLLFLCQSTNLDMFIIKRAIDLENEEDIQIILDNPLFDDNNFINQKAISGLLLSGLPSYYSDLDFDVDSDYTYNKNTLVSTSLYGPEGNIFKIYMPTELFGTIAYTEYYTFCNLHNRHDLANAAISAIQGHETGFFVIEEIEELVSAAQAEVPKQNRKLFGKKSEKMPNTILVVLKVSRTVQQENHLVKDFAYILFSVITEKEYNNSKFKGNTTASVSEEFYGDNDQFASNYMIGELRFFNIDKQFMMIKGVSKNGDAYMFLFDQNICKKLERLIDAY